MPTATFFNLSEQKRRTLIDAAESEFSRAALHEASISNIIKAAGIPRGSFYQYFENKEDLYFYLIEAKVKESKGYFISLLKKYNGDIIEAMVEMHHNFLVIMPDEEEHNFLRNAMIYATHKVENSFTDMFDVTVDNVQLTNIFELINKEQLAINDDQELLDVLKILFAVALHNFLEKTLKKLSDEEAIKHFRVQMDLIKNGVYKQE